MAEIIETYSKQRYKEYKKDDKTATLSRSCFEFGGGGSEAIIIEVIDGTEERKDICRSPVL